MRHKRLVTIAITTALMLGGGLLYHPTPASALECSILPPSICSKAGDTGNTSSDNGVLALLAAAIKILTAGVGVAATGALVYAGILYSSAGGAAEQVTKAKKIISDTVIGLIIFGLMFLALNFLIPGGVFG